MISSEKIETLNPDELNDALLYAIQNKNIDDFDVLFRHMLERDESDHELLKIGYYVCDTEDILLCEKFCHIIQSHDSKILSSLYQYVSKVGYLNNVQWLLNAYPDIIGVQDNNNYAIRWACRNGHLEVVKYLLTSSELKEHANIESLNFYSYQMACAGDHHDVVQFLLSKESGCEIPIQSTPYDMDYWFKQTKTNLIESALNMLERMDPFGYIEECHRYQMWCTERGLIDNYNTYIHNKVVDSCYKMTIEESIHV